MQTDVEMYFIRPRCGVILDSVLDLALDLVIAVSRNVFLSVVLQSRCALGPFCVFDMLTAHQLFTSDFVFNS